MTILTGLRPVFVKVPCLPSPPTFSAFSSAPLPLPLLGRVVFGGHRVVLGVPLFGLGRVCGWYTVGSGGLFGTPSRLPEHLFEPVFIGSASASIIKVHASVFKNFFRYFWGFLKMTGFPSKKSNFLYTTAHPSYFARFRAFFRRVYKCLP